MWTKCSSNRSRLQNDEEYRQKIGKLLAHRIGQIFSEFGYQTEIAVGQSNGVDLRVTDNGKLFIVGEILNWGPTSKLDANQREGIIENLAAFDCHRILIYTQMRNEDILECLIPEGITPIKIGFQLLAEYFYRRLDPDQTRGRRVDSRETRLLIKSKLTEYLQSMEMQSKVVIRQENIIGSGQF